MRTIVIDLLRQRATERHGGASLHVTLDLDHELLEHSDEAQLLRVNEALEELAALEPRLVQVVEMKYFGGLTFEQVAACLGITERTVKAHLTSIFDKLDVADRLQLALKVHGVK